MLFVPLYLVHTSLTEEALLDDDGRGEGDDVGGDHEADADRGSLTHSLPEAPTIALGVTHWAGPTAP